MKSNDPAFLLRQWQAGQSARDAQAEVRTVYGGPEKPLAKALMREAENYAHLLRQAVGDVVAKNIPGFVPDSGDITFRKVFNPPKVQEAQKKYPDLWTEFDLMNKRLSEYRPQNTHYGKMICDSKNLQEADGHANALKKIHKSLYGNFQTELYNMKNQLDLKLKDVCQPSVIMPDNPEPIHPIGGIPHGNVQANQPDNEVESLMKMIEDLQAQMQQKTQALESVQEESRQKDAIIAQQTQMNLDKQTLIDNYVGQVADLRADKIELRERNTDLTQKVAQKEAIIDELNQTIENEHTQYEQLRGQFDELTIQHQQCGLAGNAAQQPE